MPTRKINLEWISNMIITYLHSGNEWHDYPEFVQGLVQQYGARKICDIGGGANPVLPLKFITQSKLDRTVLDISSEELEKAPKGYKKLVQDIEVLDFAAAEQFDFLIQRCWQNT